MAISGETLPNDAFSVPLTINKTTMRIPSILALLLLYHQGQGQNVLNPTKVIDLPPGQTTATSLSSCGPNASKVCYTTTTYVAGQGTTSTLRSTTGAVGNSAAHHSVSNGYLRIVGASNDVVFCRDGHGLAGHDFVFSAVSLNAAAANANPFQPDQLAHVNCRVLDPQVVGGALLCPMLANAEQGVELMKVPPTGTPTLVKDIAVGSYGALACAPGGWNTAVLNNVMYFNAASTEQLIALWRSDGTEAGTRQVTSTQPGTGGIAPSLMSAQAGKLYMSYKDGAENSEPWCHDPATNTTVKLKEIRPGTTQGSDPKEFTAFKNRVIFSADDGNGRELWITNGTAAGTTLFKDLNTIGGSDPILLTPVGSDVYFFAKDATRGIKLRKLNRSETVEICYAIPLGMVPVSAIAVGDRLAYVLSDSPHSGTRYELYVTDGTAAGTKLVKPANATNPKPHYQPTWAVKAGELYYFADYTGSGEALWKVPAVLGGNAPPKPSPLPIIKK